MKNIINNRFLSIFLNVSVCIILFLFLFFKFQYEVIANDDLMDLVLGKMYFHHGRIFSELFAKFMVYYLPNLLNVHIQNFAIFSSGIVKSLLFVILCALSSSLYFLNKRSIFNSALIVITFFIFLAFLFQLKFMWIFNTFQYYFGYLLPIIYFILLWKLLINIYIQDKQIDKKTYFVLGLLSILNATGNEICFFAFLCLLILLYIDISAPEQKKLFRFLLLLNLGIAFLLFITDSAQSILHNYGIKPAINFSLTEIKDFIYVYWHKIFLENIFLWIISIFGLFFVQDVKIKKFVSFSILGFLLFFMTLYFLGQTFNYANYEPYWEFPRFWILQPGLLLALKVFLYSSSLYIIGSISKQKVKLVLLAVLLLSSGVFIYKNFKPIQLTSYEIKRTVYILDKFFNFYINRNETIILPFENLDAILPAYNNHWPKDIETKTFEGKKYLAQKYPYYWYVKKTYKLPFTKNLMIFTTEEQAIKEFEKRGGKFEENELEKLDFNLIKKPLTKKETP